MLKKSKSKMKLTGDGKYDSPGFCASYCTYIMMDSNTKYIIDCYVAEKSQTNGNSTNLEPYAFQQVLKRVIEEFNLKILAICTDRSISISKLMREKFSNIIHCYDCWHFVKGIIKTLS